MTLKAFEGRTFGKWILAGEHTVIRGGPALAFPLLSKSLNIHYLPLDAPLTVHFEGSHGPELQLLFWGVLEQALETVSIHLSHIRGQMRIQSDLPVGAGLGASAALCAGIGVWFREQGMIKSADVYEFSRQLENMFHGESSGVDIAVSLSGEGLRFVRGEKFVTIKPKWAPKLYLSYSGQRGVTSECVNKVKQLLVTNPGLGERLDEQMKESVRLCELGLTIGETEGLNQLKTALLLGRDCFEHWGLITSEFQRHIQELEEAGAWAVKPTGSGGGGYALSLWREEPPEKIRAKLISLEFLSFSHTNV
jgi:mevalonate kinase